MHTIRIKVLNEGLNITSNNLIEAIESELLTEGIEISEQADTTLKIKFTVDNDHEKVLLQLRETATKIKLRERVFPYISTSWMRDVVKEVHAIVMQEELAL
ncbi:hypothetical protein [Sanyastnella coralliicola]|uniref:hypothetical protein n=1 Tax=Sanyastnella coralliicola TaxID=3069118 RepID=UPI0027BA459D|nr:hypothetical protein [Longitalea sp. SCSIO 12813]